MCVYVCCVCSYSWVSHNNFTVQENQRNLHDRHTLNTIGMLDLGFFISHEEKNEVTLTQLSMVRSGLIGSFNLMLLRLTSMGWISWHAKDKVEGDLGLDWSVVPS
jgi:hypothetical protein